MTVPDGVPSISRQRGGLPAGAGSSSGHQPRQRQHHVPHCRAGQARPDRNAPHWLHRCAVPMAAIIRTGC